MFHESQSKAQGSETQLQLEEHLMDVACKLKSSTLPKSRAQIAPST